MEDADPGLARERTELAWTRTAISFAALGAAVLKTAPAAGIPVLALGALIWGAGRLARRPTQDASRERPRVLLLITVAVTAVSLVALVVTLAGGHSPLTPR